MRILFPLFFLFCSFSLCSQTPAQQKTIDSLFRIISTSKPDTSKVNAINKLATKIRGKQMDRADSLLKVSIQLSKKLSYEKGEANALMNAAIIKYYGRKDTSALTDFYRAEAMFNKLGLRKEAAATISNVATILWHFGELDMSLQIYQKALTIQKEEKDTVNLPMTCINMGNVYLYKSDYPHALDNYLTALRFADAKNNKALVSVCLTNIASIYSALKEYDKSIEFYTRGAAISEELGKKNEAATAWNGIGVVYNHMKEFEKGLTYYFKALKVMEELKDEKSIAYTLIYIGDTYVNMNEPEKAIPYFDRSLAICNSMQDKHGLAYCYLGLGMAKFRQKDFKAAETNLKKTLALASETNATEILKAVYDNFSQLYKETGNIPLSYDYYRKYIDIRDSALSQERKDEITRNQMQYEFDKQQALEKETQLKKDLEKEAELNRQKLIRNVFIGGFFLVALAVIMIVNALRQKNKAHREIMVQKKIIEEKNKDITDSINYALRIQEAILPPKEIKYRIFPEAFVMLMPRDVVSGDFYWFAEKNGKRLIAAADCTGHGVPGAFMSMIGNAFLNEIVNEKGITTPSEILSELRNRVITALKQTGAQGEQKDGMDISLLCFSGENKVEWAGANNPLLLIRKGELVEYTPDKRPIGYFRGKGLPFTNHEIELQKGDSLYIFTDGYADQFGGPQGKKYKYRQMKELLLRIQDEPMLKQEETLRASFSEWKGNLEQIDDVCVIGVRV